MASSTYADVAAGRTPGEEEQERWGATASLRSHTSSQGSEEAPLLGHDGTDNRNNSTWEGEADLQGLKWWRRPSVSYMMSVKEI